ncbi:ABC transporter ATP-binding protein [Salisediminibacterium halotolerans]|uniref:ABC transporter ATP-binding protein n=1 Tax=Salisediminibacterium halotolerans TaxID=517425 RepID=UPI000EB08CF4|nr:ABC transporter ATP-binding protein [Salisediminibacterium halotolerans]RLJ73149.1 ABC-2 type transport system ATP-binding protein [Actinophytocola xinjiangensis]RPE86571.1 ABC-2 type transport system ATP-binding protein [Salisediminibacterium halotolerans]TWG33946.1 ABC-2 type transport system ATP-binding protein [Salisediminibacterium halotolerans]GEL06647.1 ABC transporter ATP-binding protein [Salisediminibacterium halotolerans]
MEMIRITNLTKKFGSFTALNGVDLTVNGGEVLGFIGPNGSGKTTTIRVLLGILKKTEGDVAVFGKDAWADAVEIHKRIAYVPGDVNLWPNLTGGEVIDLFLSLRGTIDTDKRDQLIEKFHLDPTKKCRTYSKGNRQKVGLIAALASDADLFILDEPTSGLDPLMERLFQEHVNELRAEGKCIFLSSHILSEVEKLCDRVAIIREGEIIESGSLADLRHLTRTHLLVKTKTPLTDLTFFDGVHEVHESENGLSFQVDSEKIDEIIRHISRFGIEKIESAPPKLEDLFMRHYEGKKEVPSGGETDD